MISGRLFSFPASIYLYDGTVVDTNSDNVRGSRRAWGRLDGSMSEAISFVQGFVVKTHDLGQRGQTRFQGQKGSPS